MSGLHCVPGGQAQLLLFVFYGLDSILHTFRVIRFCTTALTTALVELERCYGTFHGDLKEESESGDSDREEGEENKYAGEPGCGQQLGSGATETLGYAKLPTCCHQLCGTHDRSSWSPSHDAGCQPKS
jgi:hypothetical protein